MREICSCYGSVKDVHIRRDGKTNISRGTATVVFHKESAAEQAMCYLDGCQIDGGIVKVSYVLVSAAKRNRDSSVDKQAGVKTSGAATSRNAERGNAVSSGNQSPSAF